jgi:acyl-CoA synthetase (AMP-forming)/AMP-acid ligase II
LFIDAEFMPLLPRLRTLVPSLISVIGTQDKPPRELMAYEQLVAASDPIADARRSDDELAAVLYTGGTTGKSKGVMLSHRNLMVSALGAAATGFWATPAGRYLHSAPMFHLADLSLWLAHLLGGSTHIVIPKFDPRAVLSAVAEHAVTDLFLVPTMIQMLVDDPDAADFDRSTLRRLCYGASPIGEGLLARTTRLLPQVELTQAYGMTELGPIATLLGPADHFDANQRRLRSAGRAAPHSEIAVVDEDGRPLPAMEVGEIVCRGGHVMLGYWQQPDASRDALRDGWLHTGDGGYLDNAGYLHIVDRLKDMIISGGENVYSAEVENALSTHSAVAASAVIGVPDPVYGERVHAVIVPASGQRIDERELVEHVKARIASYKTPRSFQFVTDLPKSAAGKVL